MDVWFMKYAGCIRKGAAITAGVFFFIMLRLYAADAQGNILVKVKEELTRRLSLAMKKEKRKNAFSYSYQQERLDALGVTYYSKGKVTPIVWLSARVCGVIAGLAVGFVCHPVLGGFLAVLCYRLPDYLAERHNRKDNEKMLKSIMDVYDVIFLQTNAGEYISKTLIDAYRAAWHPRLKSALIALTGDIIATNDLSVSIEVFGRKFDNENIRRLVVVVKQLVETGSSQAMLADIKKHLGTLAESYNKYEQDRVELLGNVCIFAIFSCLMGMLALACVMGLADSAGMLTA